MEVKLNPTPWQAKELYSNWLIVDANNNLVKFAENEANSKLIAAAPEMLEALKKFKETFEEKGKAKDSDFYYGFCELILKATE